MATIDFNSYLPEGEQLFDYQHAGVAYALVQTADGKGTLIADEQGLGKTRQALVTAKVRDAQKILVVCKASLKANWVREINRCAPEWSVQVLGGKVPYETDAQVSVIQFDLLTSWADGLVGEGFDAMIVDESHYVKALGTAKSPVLRTVAALKISEDVRSRKGTVLLLSGTPLLNRPVELVTQLMMIGRLEEVAPRPTGKANPTPRDWEFAFKNRFCRGETNAWGTKWDGASNLDLLNVRLRGTCYVRRLRSEVLDMEETHRIETPLSLNGGLDRYHEIERTFVAKTEQSYHLELMTALRQEVGRAKVDAAVEWVKTYREENPSKKLVVWAMHEHVQREITKALNAAKIRTVALRDFKTGTPEMQAQVDTFNEGDTEVLVCALKAHAEGFTFVGNGHNVTDCLFVEQPWHPGAVSQAEDRINRIGQEADVVFAHTLVVEDNQDTVDTWLARLIAEKWETFRAAADGSIAQNEEDDIKALLMAQLRAKFPTPRWEGQEEAG
jgi:SWI/SNF-related matrix-associated actin-dependent regulator 1 of chromatin subfamily A